MSATIENLKRSPQLIMFLTTGKLADLSNPMPSVSELKSHFGEPDDVLEVSSDDEVVQNLIYGILEFTFSNESFLQTAIALRRFKVCRKRSYDM